MAKLVENAYRDVNIAFANEFSVISEKLDINVWELIRLANHHPRVDILQPGPGVGGHCIAVDPWFIVAAAPAESRLIRTARTVNDDKPRWVLNQVCAAFAQVPQKSEIAVLGLAFKANIDDLRESPAVEIAQAIAESMPAAQINIAEPHIDSLPEPLQRRANVRLASLEEAVSRSALVVVLVDHDVSGALPVEASRASSSWTPGGIQRMIYPGPQSMRTAFKSRGVLTMVFSGCRSYLVGLFTFPWGIRRSRTIPRFLHPHGVTGFYRNW